jgi:tRNA modification GTPase
LVDQIQLRDTIYALSSGSLPSGVAIIRISGPATRRVVESVAGALPQPREAKLATIRDKTGGDIDRGLVLFFPGPASFTGEDCAELHLHGGRAVVAAALEALSAFDGLRAAEAGEFTKRAFLNGKIDLTGAEALSDLIAADTEAQRRFALANSSDAHSRIYETWRGRLIHARAMIEAELDFADEADVPGSVSSIVWSDMRALHAEITRHSAGYRDAEIIRSGFKIVILGAPNAGKSSLLNALARRDVAIVTEEPGTTRDVLEVAMDIGGMKVLLADTAGIREAAGRVEQIGIERTLMRAEEADLVLLLEDVAAPQPVTYVPLDRPVLRIGNKSDLLPRHEAESIYDCLISARTGEGLDGLLQVVKDLMSDHILPSGEVLPFRERHVALLNEAAEALDRAINSDAEGLELRAEWLRIASDALGRIHGAIDVEDLLDTIFSTFCIGK